MWCSFAKLACQFEEANLNSESNGDDSEGDTTTGQTSVHHVIFLGYATC